MRINDFFANNSRSTAKRMFGNTDKIDQFIPALVKIPLNPLKKGDFDWILAPFLRGFGGFSRI